MYTREGGNTVTNSFIVLSDYCIKPFMLCSIVNFSQIPIHLRAREILIHLIVVGIYLMYPNNIIKQPQLHSVNLALNVASKIQFSTLQMECSTKKEKHHHVILCSTPLQRVTVAPKHEYYSQIKQNHGPFKDLNLLCYFSDELPSHIFLVLASMQQCSYTSILVLQLHTTSLKSKCLPLHV